MIGIRKAVLIASIVAGVGLSYATGAVAQSAAPAAPRENIMKACGDKWRTVRDVEGPKGVTWPQFLSRCRAETASAAGAARPPAGAAKVDALKETAAKPAKTPAPVVSTPVFPEVVSPRHTSERPALARQRTCADQFKANKATGGNAGLKWIERGGGYWSKCNAHLKQARA